MIAYGNAILKAKSPGGSMTLPYNKTMQSISYSHFFDKLKNDSEHSESFLLHLVNADRAIFLDGDGHTMLDIVKELLTQAVDNGHFYIR